MGGKLYGDILSPGVRAVLLTAKVVNIELEVISIDIHKNEHLTPEYKKMNPQCTLPTLDDDGFIVWESHSIMIYLASKYGQDSSIYPANVQIQANVNKILHFDTGELFPAYSQIAKSLLTKETIEIPSDLSRNMSKQYELIELFLRHSKYIASNEMTIADFSIWTTITNSSALVPVDVHTYPKITAWLKNMESLPYKNINMHGGNLAKKVLTELLNK